MNIISAIRVFGFLLITTAALMIIPMIISLGKTPIRSNYFVLSFVILLMLKGAMAVTGAPPGPFEQDRRSLF